MGNKLQLEKYYDYKEISILEVNSTKTLELRKASIYTKCVLVYNIFSNDIGKYHELVMSELKSEE